MTYIDPAETVRPPLPRDPANVPQPIPGREGFFTDGERTYRAAPKGGFLVVPTAEQRAENGRKGAERRWENQQKRDAEEKASGRRAGPKSIPQAKEMAKVANLMRKQGLDVVFGQKVLEEQPDAVYKLAQAALVDLLARMVGGDESLRPEKPADAATMANALHRIVRAEEGKPEIEAIGVESDDERRERFDNIKSIAEQRLGRKRLAAIG